MTPRIVKDAEVRKHELMEAALRMFVERGFEETSVQDIIDAVGIAKGTFYHHFASKEELLHAVADREAQLLLDRVTEFSVAMTGDPLAEIRLLIAMTTQWKIGEQAGLTLAYLRLMYREENLSLRARMFDTYTSRLAPLFADVLAEGNALGVCAVADPETTAEIMLAMYRGMADHIAEMLLESEGRPERVHVVVEHLEAVQTAIERMLGIEPGALALYDHDSVEQALCDLLAPEGGA